MPTSRSGSSVAPAVAALAAAGREAAIEARIFRSHVHALAREAGWRVAAVHESAYPASFHWAELHAGDRTIALLHHIAIPFAAFAAPPPAYRAIKFADAPDLADAAIRCGAPFALLTPAALAADLTPEERLLLESASAGFAHDLRYWRAEALGDVLFNWWD